MKVHHVGLKLVGLAVFTALCVGVFAYLFGLAGGKVRFSEPYTVHAVVPDPFNLVENSDVRQAGVTIGKVADLEPRGTSSVVSLEIDEEYAPLVSGTTFRVRTKTLVGENYLALNPGAESDGPLEDGGTLPLAQSREAVQLDRIFDALDRPTRRQVRRNLDGLGAGLDGRGEDLNRLFAAIPPTVANGGKIAAVLRENRVQLADLAEQTTEVIGAFRARTDSVRTLAVQAKTAAEAAVSRDSELAAAIDELPSTLRQAGSTTTVLGDFSDRATPVLADLTAATGDLAPVVRDLRPAAASSRSLFAELEPFIAEANPLLTNLRRFSNNVDRGVPGLDLTLRQLLPMLQYLEPYQREFGSFFGANGSVTSSADAIGHHLRVHNNISAASYSGATPEITAAIEALQDAGIASDIGIGEDRNAYPGPGQVADGEPFSGQYERVQIAP